MRTDRQTCFTIMDSVWQTDNAQQRPQTKPAATQQTAVLLLESSSRLLFCCESGSLHSADRTISGSSCACLCVVVQLSVWVDTYQGHAIKAAEVFHCFCCFSLSTWTYTPNGAQETRPSTEMRQLTKSTWATALGRRTMSARGCISAVVSFL